MGKALTIFKKINGKNPQKTTCLLCITLHSIIHHKTALLTGPNMMLMYGTI